MNITMTLKFQTIGFLRRQTTLVDPRGRGNQGGTSAHSQSIFFFIFMFCFWKKNGEDNSMALRWEIQDPPADNDSSRKLAMSWNRNVCAIGIQMELKSRRTSRLKVHKI